MLWVNILVPPVLRIKLVVPEVLYHRMARVHNLLIEVPARPAVLGQIDHGHPSAIGIFARLFIEVKEYVVAQKPGPGICYATFPDSLAFAPKVSGVSMSASLIRIRSLSTWMLS